MIYLSKLRAPNADDAMCIFEAYIGELVDVYSKNKKVEDEMKVAAEKAAKEEEAKAAAA